MIGYSAISPPLDIGEVITSIRIEPALQMGIKISVIGIVMIGAIP
jgi:hypothetical protein